MIRSSIAAVACLAVVGVVGCEGSPSGATPSASPDNTSAPSTRPASAETKPSTTAATTAAATAVAAAGFAITGTATALPSKELASFAITVPAGGKVEKVSDDKASLELADYKLLVSKAPPKDQLAEIKTSVAKMPGYKTLTVDKSDGLVAELEEKGAKQYLVTRHVKVGDVTLVCEGALTKLPRDAAKAQEAFELCGTLAEN